MEEERFQQLLTALVVKKAKEMWPETYNGTEEDIEKLNRNEKDKNQIMQYIKELGESGELEKELTALEQEQEQMPYFKEGGKLDYLQSLKKGGKMKSKKCSCGCDLITKKEKGGKMVQSCACGCKSKLENGGKIQKLSAGGLYMGQEGFHRDDEPDMRLLNWVSENWKKVSEGFKNINWSDNSKVEAEFKRKNPQYYPASKAASKSSVQTTKTSATNTRVPNTTAPRPSTQTPITNTTVLVLKTNSTSQQFNQTVAPKTSKPKVQPKTPAKTETAAQTKPNTTTQVSKGTEVKAQPVQAQVTQPVTQPVQAQVTQPNTNVSVVDYLNSMRRASDKTARAALAKELGMSSYNFSVSDNLKLLELIKQKGRNTGEVEIDYHPTLAKPVNVPGMSIPVPKVQATPAVPGLVPRQGFNK